jgi:fumarate reductase flavoprotein subunit
MARAKELGGEAHLDTPAKKLLTANGRITGVLVLGKDGKEVHVDAKAVIIAAGGFNNDPDMLKKYSGYDLRLDPNGDGEQGDIFWLGDFRLTGDGIKMAWEAGAAKGAMGVGLWPHVPGPGVIGHQSWNMLSQMRIVQEQPYLWINRDGKRFIDEAIMDQRFQFGNVMAKQPGKCAYIIFDADTRRHMEEEAIDFEYFIFKAKTLTDIEGDMRTLMAKGNKHVFIADTLDELAEKMNICPTALKETIDTYNGFCDKGHDDQYAKDPQYLRPIRTPKFYAVKVISSAYQTIGGIKVNGKTEAVGDDRKVVPGLYAAGDIIAAEMYGDPPVLGTGLFSIALATGRIAARSALGYVGVTERS